MNTIFLLILLVNNDVKVVGTYTQSRCLALAAHWQEQMHVEARCMEIVRT